jgi:hypothetical protein
MCFTDLLEPPFMPNMSHIQVDRVVLNDLLGLVRCNVMACEMKDVRVVPIEGHVGVLSV